MPPLNPNIHKSWKAALSPEFDKPYFKSIYHTLEQERNSGLSIYPASDDIYAAFNRTPLDQVKAVIIGQDPYHNPGQAMGLSFSVPRDVKRPVSLLNIYKEIHRDLGHEIPSHGDISAWADRGVLLLNAILTVRAKSPGSHRKIGWQQFTDAVIEVINNQETGVVFMLWGNYAKSKASLLDSDKHLILESAHPSPLARGGFVGNEHFSACNEYLDRHNRGVIDWNLNDIETPTLFS